MENLDSLKIASKLLKSQREELEISIEEVSIELRLNKKIIEEIESRDFSNFKNYVFLKGYLKNYANYLGVELYLPEIKNIKNPKIDNKNSIKKNDKQKFIKYFKLFVIFLLIIITLFFIEQKTNIKNIILDNTINKKQVSKNKINMTEGNLKSNTNSYDKRNNLDLNNDDNLYLNKENSTKLDKEIYKNIENDTLKVIATDKLTIEYAGDSWTEIIDSSGNIVLLELVKKGKILEFNILAPFEILLGDATVVNIKYNNKLVQVPFDAGNNVGKIKIKN